ncbi:MAG: ferritin-like domain-containing protein [Kofleriaceae bacterium]|nr:ferritin-like domain-containing protein [Myxococcales bacterium]MCB9560617.1 ferritin-like domain-containing protein [Kofleriaceae bacterium]
MGIAGFGTTQLRYDMFDLARSADEARRLTKCANIYHRGQELAWDGRDVLGELLAAHGGVTIDPARRRALERVFAIIMWGELAAWKISAQLADGLVPLEAKMAATSQAMDEARHFYVMRDYLAALGYRPTRMDRAPQALLDLVLDTPDLARKLLGMQLMIEPMALTIFQSVRELQVEPVITELMRYYERDEARHVGLGMQYLPSLLAGKRRGEVRRVMVFQIRLLFWALAELRVLAPDFAVLGLDPRAVLERAQRKQIAALAAAYEQMGIPFGRDRSLASMSLAAAVELAFPAGDRGVAARLRAAYRAFVTPVEPLPVDELAVHAAHPIRTARGVVAAGEPIT